MAARRVGRPPPPTPEGRAQAIALSSPRAVVDTACAVLSNQTSLHTVLCAQQPLGPDVRRRVAKTNRRRFVPSVGARPPEDCQATSCSLPDDKQRFPPLIPHCFASVWCGRGLSFGRDRPSRTWACTGSRCGPRTLRLPRPLSLQHLSLAADGTVGVQLKGKSRSGRTHVRLLPEVFVLRLASLLLPSGVDRIPCFGGWGGRRSRVCSRFTA